MSMRVIGRFLAAFLAVACGIVLLSGCKKTSASGAQAFQSAAPEMKKLWDGAETAMTTNGYASALIQLRQLRAMPGLSADQTTAVDARSTEINDKMYEAANKGDPAGKKAIEDLRTALGR